MSSMTLKDERPRRKLRKFKRERKRVIRSVLTPDDDRMLLPRVAALEMQDEFRTLARQIAPRDKSTQDDLVQEMALACILAPEAKSRSCFRLLAVWRAKDYLRWWHTRRLLEAEKEEDEEERELVNGELEKACEALNRLLGGCAPLAEAQ
ncbi:MAG TPA: hypothetical protein VEJ63_08835 [Planctomycetota bacterium]|nr:hypothetical protein [Planctomycetota bacterium]